MPVGQDDDLAIAINPKSSHNDSAVYLRAIPSKCDSSSCVLHVEQNDVMYPQCIVRLMIHLQASRWGGPFLWCWLIAYVERWKYGEAWPGIKTQSMTQWIRRSCECLEMSRVLHNCVANMWRSTTRERNWENRYFPLNISYIDSSDFTEIKRLHFSNYDRCVSDSRTQDI